MADIVTRATLHDERTGTRVQLLPRTTVGRSRRCTLRSTDPSVSGEHARIDWRGSFWQLRDLGSRNGTRVDGQSVPAGESVILGTGSVIEFAQDPSVWVLLDDRDPDDLSPRPVDMTMVTSTIDQPASLADATFHFHVSSDEETARWEVEVGNQRHDLGSRAHVYLVLCLARLRVEEASVAELDRGWTYSDDLARQLGMSPETLKVQVYRARRQLQGLVLGAAGVIERRAATNQIRFGADSIQLH